MGLKICRRKRISSQRSDVRNYFVHLHKTLLILMDPQDEEDEENPPVSEAERLCALPAWPVIGLDKGT